MEGGKENQIGKVGDGGRFLKAGVVFGKWYLNVVRLVKPITTKEWQMMKVKGMDLLENFVNRRLSKLKMRCQIWRKMKNRPDI